MAYAVQWTMMEWGQLDGNYQREGGGRGSNRDDVRSMRGRLFCRCGPVTEASSSRLEQASSLSRQAARKQGLNLIAHQGISYDICEYIMKKRSHNS